VATGGCFDLLHPGHLSLLRRARMLGDALVVCVNSDASVRRRKGPGRPIVPAADRIVLLEALEPVDAVIMFEEDTPATLLETLRPDVWVKGGDYTIGELPEAAVVHRHGGQVVIIPLVGEYSTSRLVAAVRTGWAGRAGGAAAGDPALEEGERMRPLGNVLITGGASGLGAATVQAVLAAGGRALVLDRNVPSAEVDYAQVDLADRIATDNAVESLVAAGGGELQAVVTAAGIDSCGPFGEVPAEAWERVITVNLLGTARVVRAALPHLERSRGTVVTCSSTLGLRVCSDATAYCAAKFGVIGFTRALAAETAGRIGVTLLIPGGMHTAFFDGREEQYKPPPDAKLNRPQDVAAAVVYALRQPPGCELREMVVCPSQESSWP
jgi:rfaE bifunctional protein nucleotidyltransferase chain/domain